MAHERVESHGARLLECRSLPDVCAKLAFKSPDRTREHHTISAGRGLFLFHLQRAAHEEQVWVHLSFSLSLSSIYIM